MCEKEKVNVDRTYKVWIISTLVISMIIFVLFASVTVYIDPLFHYHVPLKKYQYAIDDERYQNDGITRNFEYNSIITGTSMTENFMKSEADAIFHADFIKVPFSGGYYKEINDNLRRAYDAGVDVKYVVRSLDSYCLALDKDAQAHIDYPTYLYNDKLFDDLNYVLNKSILLGRTRGVIQYTRNGYKTMSFDEYANWNDDYTFGEEAVLSSYDRGGRMRFYAH